MRRREFTTLLGGALAWPTTAPAQQQQMPSVGILRPTSADDDLRIIGQLRQGLATAGFVEGQNVTFEIRWAEGQYERFPALAADLIRRRVAIIVAPGSTPAILAAKAATSTIPIVFIVGTDPVASGVLSSLNRPDGNITGVWYLSTGLAEKRLGLLRELLPTFSIVAVLLNPTNVSSDGAAKELSLAASRIGLKVEFLYASTIAEIDVAFATLVDRPDAALLVVNDAFVTSRRVQIVTLASRVGLAAIYTSREYAEIGGLMSYGTNLADAHRLGGVYAARILKGEKPADLPVIQPTKFEFVINLSTAKALRIEVPPMLIARADEVIE
jgi:putative ABC transport system substrate-binding protein